MKNEIAEQLGEVGLPEPVSELAKRDWDAIVVGGGHNGLTSAAYLARAGKSVLVLERRERLGGACTLERPFSDPEYIVSPCAYVVGLLDDIVIGELELKRRGLHVHIADPNLWVPFDDVAVVPLPAAPERVLAALGQLRGAPLLKHSDLPAAARLAAALSRIQGLELIECNPVLVHEQGAVVVDAVAKESHT